MNRILVAEFVGLDYAGLNAINLRIVIRGAGDLASGIAKRLYSCGFRPVMTELPCPKSVRRTVCFSTAALEGEVTVEGVRARLVDFPGDGHDDYIPVVLDVPDRPFDFSGFDVIVDARMMKDLRRDAFPDAFLRIGIGPGFVAGEDCDAVVETNRGISLGRVIWSGAAEKDTGIPGVVGGKGAERVLRAPAAGFVRGFRKIGDLVEEGEIVAEVCGEQVRSPFRGVLRGLVSERCHVGFGEKIGDVDPRTDVDCSLISDKARAIGGGVLEAVLSSFGWRAEKIEKIKGKGQKC